MTDLTYSKSVTSFDLLKNEFTKVVQAAQGGNLTNSKMVDFRFYVVMTILSHELWCKKVSKF